MTDPQLVTLDPDLAARDHSAGLHDALIDPGCAACAEDGRLWLVDGRVYLPLLQACGAGCGLWLTSDLAWVRFGWPDGRVCGPLCADCAVRHEQRARRDATRPSARHSLA